MRTLLCFFLLTTVCFAEDFVRYDPATGVYQGCRSYGDTNIPLTNPNVLTAVRPGFLFADPNCSGVLPGVPDQYRKVVAGVVVEMSQAEKDAVDAPGISAAARAATFQNEITANDLCTAELADLDARIDTGVNGITDLASAKTFLRVALKKVARCIRARAEFQR